MKDLKIIRKWAKLRHPDKKFEKTAIAYYKILPKDDRIKMMEEFQAYIDAVKNGEVIAGPIKLPELPEIKDN